MNFFSYLCTKLKFHMPKRTPEIEQLLVDVEKKFGTKPYSPTIYNNAHAIKVFTILFHFISD